MPPSRCSEDSSERKRIRLTEPERKHGKTIAKAQNYRVSRSESHDSGSADRAPTTGDQQKSITQQHPSLHHHSSRQHHTSREHQNSSWQHHLSSQHHPSREHHSNLQQYPPRMEHHSSCQPYPLCTQHHTGMEQQSTRQEELSRKQQQARERARMCESWNAKREEFRRALHAMKKTVEIADGSSDFSRLMVAEFGKEVMRSWKLAKEIFVDATGLRLIVETEDVIDSS